MKLVHYFSRASYEPRNRVLRTIKLIDGNLGNVFMRSVRQVRPYNRSWIVSSTTSFNLRFML